jgi:CheY-like chemotaxis protein
MPFDLRDTKRVLVIDVELRAGAAFIESLRSLGLDCVAVQTVAEAFAFLDRANGMRVAVDMVVAAKSVAPEVGKNFVRNLHSDWRFEQVPVVLAGITQDGEPHTANNGSPQSVALTGAVVAILKLQTKMEAEEPHTNAVPEIALVADVDILVAEDNDINQMVISQFLDTTPYTYLMVGNGRRAVHAFRNARPRLILMDITMPEMSGKEATRAIRAIENGIAEPIPIVALTAHALRGDMEDCLASGMDYYVSKPVDFGKLSEILRSHLASNPDGDKEAA